MTEPIIPIAAFIGALAGWLAARKASTASLCRAHAQGLLEGRAERDWEVNAMQARIRRLEADVRRFSGGLTRNGAR